MTNPNDEFPEVRLSDVLFGDGFPVWGPRTPLSDAVLADGLERIREMAGAGCCGHTGYGCSCGPACQCGCTGCPSCARRQAQRQRRVAREVSAAWDRMTYGQETISLDES